MRNAKNLNICVASFIWQLFRQPAFCQLVLAWVKWPDTPDTCYSLTISSTHQALSRYSTSSSSPLLGLLLSLERSWIHSYACTEAYLESKKKCYFCLSNGTRNCLKFCGTDQDRAAYRKDTKCFLFVYCLVQTLLGGLSRHFGLFYKASIFAINCFGLYDRFQLRRADIFQWFLKYLYK